MQRRYRISFPALGLLAAATAGMAAPVNRDPEWVAQRVQQWQPTAKEKRWEGIGWAKDIREAIRLAKQNQRPVFLFTHDGRLNVGRC
jgi:hypothetical protein